MTGSIQLDHKVSLRYPYIQVYKVNLYAKPCRMPWIYLEKPALLRGMDCNQMLQKFHK